MENASEALLTGWRERYSWYTSDEAMEKALRHLAAEMVDHQVSAFGPQDLLDLAGRIAESRGRK